MRYFKLAVLIVVAVFYSVNLFSQSYDPAVEIESLYKEYRALILTRSKIIKLKRNLSERIKEYNILRTEYHRYSSKIDDINAILERTKKDRDKETKKMRNKLKVDRDTYILKKQNTIIKMKKIIAVMPVVEGKINSLVKYYFSKHYEVTKKYENIGHKELTDTDKIYLKSFASDIARIVDDFRLAEVPFYTVGNDAFVDVVINRLVPAKFLVDFDSGFVGITEGTAESLEIERDIPMGVVNVKSLGVVYAGEPAVLRSLNAGNKIRYNVGVLIVPDLTEYDNADGVLGMSFFYDAVKQVDEEGEKIKFYFFTPR